MNAAFIADSRFGTALQIVSDKAGKMQPGCSGLTEEREKYCACVSPGYESIRYRLSFRHKETRSIPRISAALVLF